MKPAKIPPRVRPGDLLVFLADAPVGVRIKTPEGWKRRKRGVFTKRATR